MTVFDVSQLFANLTFLYVLIGLENLCSQKYVDGKSICLARNEDDLFLISSHSHTQYQKGTLCRFQNLPLWFNSNENNTLKVSHS